MTAIAFWNVQRLSAGSADERTGALESALKYFENTEVEILLLCEVVSKVGLQNIQVIKVGAKQNKFYEDKQLGYGVLHVQNQQQPQFLVQNTCLKPAKFNEIFGFPIWLRGGNTFKKQSKRHLFNAVDYGTTPICVFHANSSHKAAAMVTWAVGSLDKAVANFVLVGDFNCEPGPLKEALTYAYSNNTQGLNLDNISIDYGGPTFSASDPRKTYDYAIAKGHKIKVKTARLPDNERFSDHLPIVIRFT